MLFQQTGVDNLLIFIFSLHLVNTKKAHCIDIIPKWTAQHWYPVILEMTINKFTIKPAPNNLLLLQGKEKLHSLHKNLTLAAVINTVEIVSSNYILQAHHLQFWNIKPIKPNGRITACITIYPTFSLKEENCWTTLLIGIIQGQVKSIHNSNKSSHIVFLTPCSSILDHTDTN